MPTFDTALTRLLGIRYPLVQAPIGSASTPELVAAVSNAGGLGMLSITWRAPDEVRQLIQQVRQLTGQPFGVNLVLQWDPAERLAIALEENVPVVSFFWGDPKPHIAQCHDAGSLVFTTVGTPWEGARDAESGSDVIVAQGWEAGGHVWGTMATGSLVPATVDAVAPTPVIAAGGITDGRGIAAAISLGAVGVWLGTRFLFASETPIHSLYRERLIRSDGLQTVHTNSFDVGWPNANVRVLRNDTWERWEEAGRPSPGSRPGETDVVAVTGSGEEVVRYSSNLPMADMTGAVESLAMYSGQGVGLISTVQPAADIVESLMQETAVSLRLANASIVS